MGSIRGVARSTGHDKNAICRWVDMAGSHCREVNDYYLTELHLDRVQVDEIWSYIKKRYVFSSPRIARLMLFRVNEYVLTNNLRQNEKHYQ